METMEDKPGRRPQRDILILIAGIISRRWVIIVSVDIVACIGILGIKSWLVKIRDTMCDSPTLGFPDAKKLRKRGKS